jgi:hypothetical protein
MVAFVSATSSESRALGHSKASATEAQTSATDTNAMKAHVRRMRLATSNDGTTTRFQPILLPLNGGPQH